MINKKNFKALLHYLAFDEKGEVFIKNFEDSDVYLKVDFKKEEIEYPEKLGLKINERQTCNFSSSENIVVLECVFQLLEKGYKPQHIELEPKWKVGHGASGGRADILVKNQNDKPILIIECKTYKKEFEKAWKDTQKDGGQLFSYAQQISETKFLCLYASEFDEINTQILREQRIISHKDNEKILEQFDEPKSFKKASNVEQRYEVWKETYKLEYTQTGIFESNIQPYHIGKNNYTLDIDTRPVRNEDKEGKYHTFRTILRQHNIARKETAFEVLVNLFLAKLVDEEENKNNLEFYWKGVAYDNYYDFIDRLQKLYQIGMRKFLKDEVMYISNKDIDDAFWTVKNQRNATKKQIQKYFTDLKFYSNNAFSLINVHNKRLFEQNTKVLVELVQMWQGLRLKTKEQNQFLGDMFEYFLDNSIKQSEGQFFTPMPITKFIISSLPLEDKIAHSSEPIRAIDYACGSGHFLTEYAHQIKPLVEKYKETDISKYYENIVGIEKEDRLAKIAKVSAYMYGQEQIKILEKDALTQIQEIENDSFDVLVANPPFSVEGFLLNLSEKEKKYFTLMKTTELNSNTNNIQCFFIERAKQIMKPKGVIGIIVPSSILSNTDSTHIGTREIILKYFDIISIVELGGGTFGKTGTNTVVLYLKRKSQKPEPSEHYANRVKDYFDNTKLNDKNNIEYQDFELIKAYCQHNELIFDEYIKLFTISSETISNLDTLFQCDMFKDYKKDFEQSTEIKNIKTKKTFKDKQKEEQEQELNKKLINYLYKIEKDKLLYFMLAYENEQKVLIIKSPSNKKEEKKFLGYEWSGAKGSEGIKYIGGNSLNDIMTPLFNPTNPNDKTKLNYLIQQNFLGKEPNDLREFEQYKDLVSYVNVIDILDFTRKDFSKVFSLTAKKDIVIDTKWELVKLGEIIIEHKKSRIKVSDAQNNQEEIYIFFTSGEKSLMYSEYLVDGENIYLSTGGNAIVKYFDGKASYSTDTYSIKSYNENIISTKFLFLFLENRINIINNFYFKGIALKHLQKPEFKEMKIPLPLKDIQEKIVQECEVINRKNEEAKQIIDNAKIEIENSINEVYRYTKTFSNLENICSLKRGRFSHRPRNEPRFFGGDYPFIQTADVVRANGNSVGYAQTLNEDGLKVSKLFEPTIVLVTIAANIGDTAILDYPACFTDSVVGLTPFDNLNVYFLEYMMRKQKKNLDENAPKVAQKNINIKILNKVRIPIPPISKQEILVTKIKKLETKINNANDIINSSAQKKEEIMDRYLK